MFTLSTLAAKDVAVVVLLNELLKHLTFNINVMLIARKRSLKNMYEEKSNKVSRLKNAIKLALYLSGVFMWSDVIPWLKCRNGNGSR